ncbi:HutD/Ves family protein [Mobilicoccus massiliensis]|uniref:HutD/Ves family protein n=1 Tax=Mobilicoccus massiliensis TaxID=1522310 RepID=UPI000694EDB8|nr:HutD family protein [Mobilicoccus massiliensis]
MPMTIRRRDDHAEMPWRNGGGTTLEVARSPEGSDDEFDWRLSFAHVEGNGPFSVFPGVDRVLVLVEGEEMRLKLHDDEEHTLRSCEAFAFAGESEVTCEVPAPTWDLNVMTRRGAAAAVVRCQNPATGRLDVVAPDGGTLIVAALTGRPEVRVGERSATLEPFDVVLTDDASDIVNVDGEGVVAIVTIETPGTGELRS